MISEREYRKMRDTIEARCRRDLEALDRVWEMAHGQAPPKAPTPKSKATPESTRKTIGKILESAATLTTVGSELLNKRGAVRLALQSLTGEFGTKDVRGALERTNPEASRMITDVQLMSVVARLADLDEIHVVVPKSGRRPALYAQGPKPVVEAQAS